MEQLSLFDLNSRIKDCLKKNLEESYWVVAEIGEMRFNQKGHCYLELIEKHPDNDSLLARAKATIWASRYSMLRPYFESSTNTRLKSGIKLLCK